jgi:hypothetical protein
MANGFNPDSLVNPRQRVHARDQFGTFNDFGNVAAPGTIALADLAHNLEVVAAQIRTIAQASRPTNVWVHIGRVRIYRIRDLYSPNGHGGAAASGADWFGGGFEEIVQ